MQIKIIGKHRRLYFTKYLIIFTVLIDLFEKCINPRNTINSEISVVSAAPLYEKNGMNIKFKIRLLTAPNIVHLVAFISCPKGNSTW